MAWQPPGAMSNGTAGGGAEHNGAAGTEFTLQGVMRFLQVQWHTHERDRNSWDIERAEMKAKIAKQEGDFRHAKQMNEQSNRQIRMLEQALRNERAKTKALRESKEATLPSDSAQVDKEAETKKKDSQTQKDNPATSALLEVREDAVKVSDGEQTFQRDKVGNFMNKSLEEMMYLTTTPVHPAGSQHENQGSLANSNANNYAPHAQPPSVEEIYMQQARSKSVAMHQAAASQMINHHPSLMNNNEASNNLNAVGSNQHDSSPMERQTPNTQAHLLSSLPQNEASPRQSHGPFSNITDEPAENVVHSYDSFGRPISSQEENPVISTKASVEDAENWTFEVEPPTPNDDPSETQLPRRPDTHAFPTANSIPVRSPPRAGPLSHRRKSSDKTGRRRSSDDLETREAMANAAKANELQNFKVRFALRGHLDVVRSVIFTGGGSPSEPELCTAGDDGMIKRWIVPASFMMQQVPANDLDISSYFTHRGHEGMVLSLAACPASAFSTGGRASGDGWIFSGGQDATVRVWERGRVDPKATLEGHTDAVWAVCVLPATSGAIFAAESNRFGGADRIILVSGSADGTVKVWAVSAPPQLLSPQTGSRRGVGGSRRHSVTSGSNYPSSPQPSVATSTPFNYTLIHSIPRRNVGNPTCITPLSPNGETFVVSYSDASVLIFDTRTGEEVSAMASAETYDGTPATGINSVVATGIGTDGNTDSGRGAGEEELHGATGAGGVEGVVITGHEDQYIRFFDANSGQCTYSMRAHPAAISSLSLSKDGREAVSAGHDASIRLWDLEKRICTQEITSHRIMRGEGVCGVMWSQDGRLIVSAGGDSVVKVFAR